MAKRIIVGGRVEIITDLSLESLQDAVGGYIELVRTKNGRMLVNEDGRMLQLKFNQMASDLADIDIFGDVVLLDREDKF